MQMRSTFERLGDDHEIGPSLRNPPDLGEVRHAGKAAALFVHGAADFQRPRQPHARARDRFSGEHRRRDTGLHVADAAAVNLSVPHQTAERIHRPAFARRDDIDVAVEVNDRSRTSAPGADDVHARIPRRVLGPPSAAMYSTSNARCFRNPPRKSAHAS